MNRRILNILISIDQLILSLITLGSAYPDETISSYAYRCEKLNKRFGFARPIIDKVFFWDPQHCRKAYLAEVFRHQNFKGRV